jgi:hypothetical protein
MNNPDITQVYLNIRREERNKLLDDSDKYLLSDFPITFSNLELVKEYRQELRDYMNLEGIKNYNFNLIIPDFPQFPILK